MMPIRAIAAGMVAATLAVVAVVVALQAAPSPAGGVAQLWMRPTGSTPAAVEIGVDNAKPTPLAFRLELQESGVIVKGWPSISVAPGDEWRTSVRLGTSARAVVLQAVLYDARTEQVLRRVDLASAGGG
jgi:hypothetical protein